VLRLVKKDPTLMKIPVIVLTTSNAGQDIEQRYAAGANSYVQKPVELEGLIKAIARLSDYWLHVSVLPKDFK
jgi:CheY-like chemotaxis protein